MKRKELCKAGLTKELSEKIWFFKIEEGGAMGSPGDVTFITNDGTVYGFNYIYADTTFDDVRAFFPAITKCMFAMFGKGSIVLKDGNTLILAWGIICLYQMKSMINFRLRCKTLRR